MNLLNKLLRDESGQGMVEYGLILALIAVALIAGMTVLREQIAGIFTRITEALRPAPITPP
ncbi:MAG: Flp family type IVb pilin [Firmicutes bacterium]|nr:Flp family type IVb pilin [Dethiobacter sp.]MBS3889190.1 Flp family type IVb pilin [Bacillota bacterium]MBS4055666.1 Flp family type IVb pilin [Thermaerobacter sp.]